MVETYSCNNCFILVEREDMICETCQVTEALRARIRELERQVKILEDSRTDHCNAVEMWANRALAAEQKLEKYEPTITEEQREEARKELLEYLGDAVTATDEELEAICKQWEDEDAE